MAKEAAVTVEEQKVDRARERTRAKPKGLPPYAVILYNDDLNTFDFVIATLQKVFGYSYTKAFQLTMQAHTGGRALVWSGAKEHAELKSEQIRSCGADPRAASLGAAPLRTRVEPLPG